jgi:hypothetical protein
LEAVFHRSNGPVALRKTTTGWQSVPLKLGAASKTQVEILSGLTAGDEVATIDVEVKSP